MLSAYIPKKYSVKVRNLVYLGKICNKKLGGCLDLMFKALYKFNKIN